MTRPGIEPGSPGLLANTLTIMPMSGQVRIIFDKNIDFLFNWTIFILAQSAGAAEYTDCISAKTSPASVLNMIQNNLIVRLL